MSRVQLALNVADLQASIDFYTKLFGTPPAKIRDGYANFAIADPPLKLVLFEGAGEPGTLNHVGVEVGSVEEVADAAARVQGEGLGIREESGACCYAVQDKVWVSGPEIPWEIYTVLADSPVLHLDATGCCVPDDTVSAAAGGDEAEEALATASGRCC